MSQIPNDRRHNKYHTNLIRTLSPILWVYGLFGCIEEMNRENLYDIYKRNKVKQIYIGQTGAQECKQNESPRQQVCYSYSHKEGIHFW